MKKDCRQCPYRTQRNEPSPSAIERIHYLQSSGGKRIEVDTLPGCSYAIDSVEHNYCFWVYAESLNLPVEDKEVRQLLCLTQIQIKEITENAINKLQNIKDNALMTEFKEILLEKIDTYNSDNSFVQAAAVTPDEVEENTETEEKIREDILSLKKKGMNITGQPLHRDGKKVDLYGLYTRKGKKK
jgi:hypothetical protein